MEAERLSLSVTASLACYCRMLSLLSWTGSKGKAASRREEKSRHTCHRTGTGVPVPSACGVSRAAKAALPLGPSQRQGETPRNLLALLKDCCRVQGTPASRSPHCFVLLLRTAEPPEGKWHPGLGTHGGRATVTTLKSPQT